MAIAYIYLIASAVLWGGVFHVIHYPLSVAPPFVLLTARFSLTALLLLPWLLIRHNYRLALGRRNFYDLLFLSVVGICGYNTFFTYGMTLTEPATGALIIAANPAMTTLIARIWKKERISPVRWLGIATAFAGLTFIVFKGDLGNALQLRLAPGNLVLLGAPFAWAVYSVKSREVLQRMPTTVVTAALILLSLPPQAALAAVQLDGWRWAVEPAFWWPVLYLGIFATGVSYLCWNKGVELIGAARSSVFVNLIPVTTLLVSLLLGQPLNTYHYIGGLIVVAGVILATRR